MSTSIGLDTVTHAWYAKEMILEWNGVINGRKVGKEKHLESISFCVGTNRPEKEFFHLCFG